MPEDPSSTPPTPPAAAPASTPAEGGATFDISEEYGTAAKNLPPTKIVLIGLAIIVTIAVVVSFVQRPHASASGSIDDVVAVEIPNQNAVMVAINVSFQNHGKKPFWIHNIKVDLDTGSDKFSDEAAAVVDFDRYFQALPALKEHALQPLQPESMVDPGGETRGMIVVSFPVSPEVFANRKSITVTIRPYDQPVALVLTK
jgi:hypothetical protein